MGQIDLFEPDHTEKVVSEILDDKALSEILEVPDDQTLSEILEIPDFTERDNKADNGSDVLELECKVEETKDAVRLDTECGLEHGAEFVESDPDLVAHFQTGERGSLVNASFGHTGLVACKSKVTGDCNDLDAHQSEVAHLGVSPAQTFQDGVLPGNALAVNLHKSEVICDATNDNNFDITIGSSFKLSEVGTDESGSIDGLSMVSGPGLASRCLSPKVDISIPPRIKSNSLASRGNKEPVPVSLVSETVENSNRSDPENELLVDKTGLDNTVEVKSTADPGSIGQTGHCGANFNKSQSTVSSKLNMSSPQKAEKSLKAKVAIGLKEKDKSVATGSFVRNHAPQNLKYQSSSFSSFKEDKTDSPRDKSPAARVYRNIPRIRGPRHVIVSLDNEIGAKGKHHRQAEKDVKSSRNKPTYV